jgi:hypothetical protein
MNPVKDLWNLVAMPIKAAFVVGLCGLINWMTFAGTWWVKWVALGMGIATLVAVGKGLRALLLLALIAWAGRTIHRRYGQAVRERFDAWVSSRNPQWAQWTDVVDAVRTGSPAPQPVQH